MRSFSSSNFERLLPVRLANPTQFLRLLSNTRHCPPSSNVSRTRFTASSLFTFFIGFWVSLKLIVSPRNTPSRSSVGRQSLSTSCAPSQSAISYAFPMVAESPMIWASGLSRISFASVTSSVGPRFAESKRCISSATTVVISFIHEVSFLSNESVFSEVATMMSFIPSHSSLESKSPVEMPTLTPSGTNSLNRSYFSDASARSGTMYNALPPLEIDFSMANSARRVLPEAVGIAASIFLFLRRPFSTASACGG